MTFIDLLNAAKANGSDYALSKKLGVTRQYISKLRNKKEVPSLEMTNKLAELGGINRVSAYLVVLAERLEDKEVSAQFRLLAS